MRFLVTFFCFLFIMSCGMFSRAKPAQSLSFQQNTGRQQRVIKPPSQLEQARGLLTSVEAVRSYCDRRREAVQERNEVEKTAIQQEFTETIEQLVDQDSQTDPEIVLYIEARKRQSKLQAADLAKEWELYKLAFFCR